MLSETVLILVKHCSLLESGYKAYKSVLDAINQKELFEYIIKDQYNANTENCIRLENDDLYRPTKEGWEFIFLKRAFSREDINTLKDVSNKNLLAIKNKEELLIEKLLKIKKIFTKSYKKKTLEHFIQTIFKKESFILMIHQTIINYVKTNQNTTFTDNKKQKISVTKFTLSLCDVLCYYLIKEINPTIGKLLLKLEHCKTNEDYLNLFLINKEIILDFFSQDNEKIKNGFLILKKHNNKQRDFINEEETLNQEKNEMFEKIIITNKDIYELLWFYIRKKLNVLYNIHLKENDQKIIIKESQKPLDIKDQPGRKRAINKRHLSGHLNEYNTYTLIALKVGGEFIDKIFVKSKIFEIKKEFQKDPYHLILNPEILQQILQKDTLPEFANLHPQHDRLIEYFSNDYQVFADKYTKKRLLHQKQHEGSTVRLQEKIPTYLNTKDNNKKQTRYCIFTDYLIVFLKDIFQYIILYYKKTDNYSIFKYQNSNIKDNDQTLFIKSYIEMHGVNYPIYQKYYDENPEAQQIIDDLFFKLIDFNKHYTPKQLEKYVKKEYKHILPNLKNRKLIYELINIFLQSKYITIRTLNDAIFYSLFDHFYMDYFLDFRGRIYPTLNYLNITTSNTAKLILKLYDINMNNNRFDDEVKQVILNILKHEEPKKKISQLNNENMLFTNQQLFIDYLITLFNNDTTSEYIQDLLDNKEYTNIILFSKINPKEEKERLFIYSLIYAEKLIRKSQINGKPIRFINCIEKDARTGGLQMISILFQSPTLAKWANLSGTELIDIYSTITEQYNKHIKSLDEICLTIMNSFSFNTIDEKVVFMNNIENIGSKKLTEEWLNDLKNESNLKILLHSWLSISLKSPKVLLKSFMNILLERFPEINMQEELMFTNRLRIQLALFNMKNINNAKKEYEEQDISEKDFYTNNNNKEQKSSKIITKKKAILQLRYIFHHNILFKYKLPFLQTRSIFTNRKLFKHAIMTWFYNSKFYSRKNAFIEFIRKYHIISPQHMPYVKYLVKFLDDFFLRFLTKIDHFNLPYKLTKYFSEKGQKLIIEQDFIICEIAPLKKIKDKMHSQNKQLVVKIVDTNENPNGILDINKLKNRVLPNIIHSMDSTICHLFKSLIQEINEKTPYYFKLSLETNHDCFILSNNTLLMPLLIESYLRLSKTSYLKYIVNLQENEEWKSFQCVNTEQFIKLITPMNPNFCK